jgi:adenine deaminase
MTLSDADAKIVFIERAIEQALGLVEADLVLKNVRLFDLVTGDLVPTDIAICGDRIVGTLGPYDGEVEIECGGRIAVPGFIDAHLHVESSLVSPLEFDRMVLPRGTTTAVCDPHEIANVLGADGIRYMLAAADAVALDLRVMLSSCVPATHLETSGARLDADDLLALRDHPKVLGLAEMMNYPGVLARDPVCIQKLAAFAGGQIDGHAPLVRGADLNAYLAAGIRSDHETTTAAEGREKLAKGMSLYIREGSVSKDLPALAPLITPDTALFCAFCTDDRNPLDVAESGHIDANIRQAIGLGVRPLDAYRVATIGAALALGLRDRGLVAPGRRADVVLLDDLDTCAVWRVIAGGNLVDEALFAARPALAPVGLGSVRAEPVSAADFAVASTSEEGPVIGVVAGRIITENLTIALPIADGLKQVDTAKDVVKVAVVARHGRKRNIGAGFVQGFGLTQGAIASSVGHDSHNLTVIGADDSDMAAAVNRLIELQGGFVVVRDGQVLAELALPIAGLMSLLSAAEVLQALERLREAAWSLGCTLPDPFLQVAFLPLPVIPHLKITDMGLVDVDRFAFVPA